MRYKISVCEKVENFYYVYVDANSEQEAIEKAYEADLTNKPEDIKVLEVSAEIYTV